MSSFKRENRYFVIKLSDVEKLPFGARRIVETNMECVDFYLSEHGASNRQYLVIESDWPEYEPVWSMIEQRMTGRVLAVEHQQMKEVPPDDQNSAWENTFGPHYEDNSEQLEVVAVISTEQKERGHYFTPDQLRRFNDICKKNPATMAAIDAALKLIKSEANE